MDLIDRQAAQTELMMKCERYTLARESHGMGHVEWSSDLISVADAMDAIRDLPSAQPERKWTPCSNPPKHHKDVIVRGIEAIGNVTVHKVMQWDVDTWRPTDYAPSIMWKEWSEI